MSQLAPTSCIHVPTLEATAAIHRVRNSFCRSGTQAEVMRGSPARRVRLAATGFLPSSVESAMAFLEYNGPSSRRDQANRQVQGACLAHETTSGGQGPQWPERKSFVICLTTGWVNQPFVPP